MRRFRSLMALLTVLILVLALAPAATAAEHQNLNAADLQKANVTIDGTVLNADAFIVADRTMVPLRAIFEALGATIEWDAATFTVTATKGSKIIKLTVGEITATVNGQPVTLAVAPVLINSRTFVPLRFVSQALDYEVGWDAPNWTAQIKTGGGCTLAPFQKHEGYIAKGGETWGRCGSPHLVTGTFRVEGADSPILSIEAGTVIQFEQDARIDVGDRAPGGLKVYGKATDPAVFTAATSGPQPGYWSGIRFYNQTLVNDTVIEGARIEYAGQETWGAVYVEGHNKMVEVLMKDVEIKNSLGVGLRMVEQGRLKSGSANLKINGTTINGSEGGFPIMTAVFGSHNLPRGEFKNNALNAVNVYENGSAATIGTNTTWRNVSIPYAISQYIDVEGNASPTLTIEPGVITLWKNDTYLTIGAQAPGYLVADATARPEGGGEWFTRPEGGGEWKVDKAELDLGVQLGNAASIEPQCGLCGKNRAIVFGAWASSPDRGAWGGINIRGNAGDKSKLVGTVIAYGGTNQEYGAGLLVESSGEKTVKFLLQKSMITGAARSGLETYGKVEMKAESTGNIFLGNGWPIRMEPDHVGYLPAGQTFAENEQQYISVSVGGSTSGDLTKTATWRNHGIPYFVDLFIYIGGPSSPKLTIEAGTTINFGKEGGIRVGSSNGAGSLIAVGAAGKPIKFTSELARKGAWNGLEFSGEAGAGNRLEYAVIEYASTAVSISDDMGGFIKNTTIRSSGEMGINRAYDSTGTDFLKGLGNQFEGNAADQNE